MKVTFFMIFLLLRNQRIIQSLQVKYNGKVQK